MFSIQNKESKFKKYTYFRITKKIKFKNIINVNKNIDNEMLLIKI